MARGKATTKAEETKAEETKAEETKAEETKAGETGKKVKVVSKKHRIVNPFTKEVFNVNQPILAVNDDWLKSQLDAKILFKA